MGGHHSSVDVVMAAVTVLPNSEPETRNETRVHGNMNSDMDIHNDSILW
jgi:hypothetical protein